MHIVTNVLTSYVGKIVELQFFTDSRVCLLVADCNIIRASWETEKKKSSCRKNGTQRFWVVVFTFSAQPSLPYITFCFFFYRPPTPFHALSTFGMVPYGSLYFFMNIINVYECPWHKTRMHTINTPLVFLFVNETARQHRKNAHREPFPRIPKFLDHQSKIVLTHQLCF